MKNLNLRYFFFILILSLITFIIDGALAVSSQDKPKNIKWPFDGIFGYFDKRAIQRGFQVYKEVCQTCHSLRYISYRNLEEVGFSPQEVKAIASGYQITDGPNDQGEMFQRPANPTDMFVPPYENEKAARAANNGAYPVDLSLIVNARPNGANYVYSILTGYLSVDDANALPKGFKLSSGMHFNPYFPNKQIAMPPPLSDNLVSYADGTEATIDQMAKDIVTFLQWTAEPEMENRKLMGIKITIYLIIFTIIFYLAKRRIWRKIK